MSASNSDHFLVPEGPVEIRTGLVVLSLSGDGQDVLGPSRPVPRMGQYERGQEEVLLVCPILGLPWLRCKESPLGVGAQRCLQSSVGPRTEVGVSPPWGRPASSHVHVYTRVYVARTFRSAPIMIPSGQPAVQPWLWLKGVDRTRLYAYSVLHQNLDGGRPWILLLEIYSSVDWQVG
jgi:hypothetical protein